MYKLNYINHKNYFKCKPYCFICACFIDNLNEYELDATTIKFKKIMLYSLQNYFIVNNLLNHSLQMELCFFDIRNQLYDLKHVIFYEDDNTIFI